MTLTLPTLFAITFFFALLYAIDRVAYYKQRVRDLELIVEQFTETHSSGGNSLGGLLFILFLLGILLFNLL